ncbi:DCC1-like thiol-disulfide oxidoreductase family protein [Vibrio sp. PP-XX7]
MGQTNIIVFDGVCNLCNRVFREISEENLATPCKSDYAGAFITRYHASGTDLDTFYSSKTDVVLQLILPWKFRDLSVTGICYVSANSPKPIRNYFYNLIARNRYKLFGQRMICMVPTEEMSHRFRV